MTQPPDALQHFLRQTLGESPFTLTRVAGDASFRCYYRVETAQDRFILMDAPPDKEDSAPFLDIARFLGRHAVPVPQVIHARLEQGYLLLQDFGDVTFLEALRQNVDPKPLYRAAIHTLLEIQATPIDGSCIAHHRPFDREMLRRELALFTDWYIEKIRETPISDADRQQFETLFTCLLDKILQQPTVFVHRDYHSRNLMWQQGEIGVLDFQDAVVGPITYDLASLLRDCYVAWPADFRAEMIALWLEGARVRLGYTPHDPHSFQQDFDWMAIQRNLKAIGIFGRLSRRDGKHGYLNDIPRTMGYVRETLSRYPALQGLDQLIEKYAP
ncbi:MAG: phosphotransferase [Magnetococcales bacterium]|nr:phosphotransferase [Magnetococcales bacterium]